MDRKQARAFEGFVTESGDGLLRMATLLTADPDAAEDVYQETLHRLAMRWSRVDSPRAFCRRVMHNIVIDQARARKRRPPELFTVHDRGDPRAGDPVTAAELRPRPANCRSPGTTRPPRPSSTRCRPAPEACAPCCSSKPRSSRPRRSHGSRRN